MWPVLDKYFREQRYFLTYHHLQSFDNFVQDRVHRTVASMNFTLPWTKLRAGAGASAKKSYAVSVRVRDVKLIETPVLPNIARLYDLTYMSDVTANIDVDFIVDDKNVKTSVFEGVKIGAVPVMLHSKICRLRDRTEEQLKHMGECPFDQGGYFIIDGKEKCIIAQERVMFNRLIVNKRAASITSVDDDELCVGVIRCLEESISLFPRRAIIKIVKNNKKRRTFVTLSMTHLGDSKDFPLFVVFRLLGIEDDKRIIRCILGDEYAASSRETAVMYDCVLEAGEIYTQQQAVELLATYTEYKNSDQLKYIVEQELFPNAGTDFKSKAAYLGVLVKQMLDVHFGKIVQTSSDDYINKRLDVSGVLLADLFRDYYRRFVDNAKRMIDREYYYGPWVYKQPGGFAELVTSENLSKIFSPYIIQSGMVDSFKGKWNVDKSAATGKEREYLRTGIVQDLNRISYLTYVSHIRRIDHPFDRSLKLVSPHMLRSTQWGAVCPSESPDGINLGLIKHLSYMTHVTLAAAPEVNDAIVEWMRSQGLMTTQSGAETSMIFLNENVIGKTSNPKAFVDAFRGERRKPGGGVVARDHSIRWKIFQNFIEIRTDGGRMCRPLVLVEKLGEVKAHIAKANWFRDVLGSYVELIDTDELCDCLIASYENQLGVGTQYTHVELHPALMMSAVSATYPFLEHNDANYNTLALAQFKQGVGTYVTNFQNRMDVLGVVLHYPQKPLVGTTFSEKMCNGKYAAAQNAIAAIMTYTGYNQEDGVILNLDSVRRGMFNISYYKTVKDEEIQEDHQSVHFRNPFTTTDGAARYEQAAYQALDPQTGLPIEGTIVMPGQIILGKVRKVSTDSTSTTGDASLALDSAVGGKCIIDRVLVYGSDEPGKRRCKIRLRQFREPELGDKFGSRYGQKGCCGLLLPAKDMPFSTATGVVPDIIVNPNAFPKRKTVGHFLDAMFGKACCQGGRRVTVNMFEPHDFQAGGDAEGAWWWNAGTDELLQNGRTGHQMQCKVFMGVNYYGRLKHMVMDKQGSRSTGPKDQKTRQPAGGRSNEGGMRIGEMETHALLAHGSAGFIKETIMERSDKTTIQVDGVTGIANVLPGSTLDSACVQVPYAFKMMQQEMSAMGIDTRYENLDKASPEENDTYEEFFLESDDEEDGGVVASDE